MIIKVYWCSCKVPVILVKFKFDLNFLTDFQEHSNMKFHENPPTGSRAVTRGWTERQTDRLDEANSHFLQVCGCT